MPRSFSRFTLRTHLLLLILIALLPSLALALHGHLQARRQAADAAQDQVLRLARWTSMEQEQFILMARQVLTTMTRLPELRQGDTSRCNELAADLLAQQPLFSNLGVVALDGMAICSGAPLVGPVNLADRLYFQRARDTGTFAMGDYQIGRITGKATVAFGYPIFDQDDRLTAVAFAAMNLDWLNQLAAEARLPDGSALTVVDQGGTILSRYPAGDRWVGRSLADTPLFEAMQAQAEGVTQSPGVDGVDRLYAFTPLDRRSMTPIAYVVVGVPTTAANASADNALRTGLILLGVVGVFTLGLALVSSELFIRRPIRGLLGTTTRLATGDLSARLRDTQGTSELSQLADAFNHLATSLQCRQAATERAEDALRESNRQLHAALVELQLSHRQVIQQERLRALGQMASGVAHDFNNALSPIVAYTDLLLMQPEKLADWERTSSFLEMIQTAAEDATGVVRRLREVYRQRTGDEVVDPVQLEDLVAQVISLTQFRWKDQAQARGASIIIKTDLQPGPPVAGNAADLREALTNLVFNAVDALPDGGTITISTRMFGDAAVLEIRDTGVGMTEEVRLRCLEPFFTTKGEYGTGLGLGLVYGIIQRHQGTLAIESAPGAGTIFILRLPIWSQGEVTVDVPSVACEAEPLRILVVEDEPLVRRAFVEYLSVDGHTVESAADGRAGLAQFRVGAFDLVLTDRALPELSGDQVAAAIRQLEPDLPVIMVTGFGDLMSQDGERPEGVDLVVSKPVTLSALRQAIAQVTRP